MARITAVPDDDLRSSEQAMNEGLLRSTLLPYATMSSSRLYAIPEQSTRSFAAARPTDTDDTADSNLPNFLPETPPSNKASLPAPAPVHTQTQDEPQASAPVDVTHPNNGIVRAQIHPHPEDRSSDTPRFASAASSVGPVLQPPPSAVPIHSGAPGAAGVQPVPSHAYTTSTASSSTVSSVPPYPPPQPPLENEKPEPNAYELVSQTTVSSQRTNAQPSSTFELSLSLPRASGANHVPNGVPLSTADSVPPLNGSKSSPSPPPTDSVPNSTRDPLARQFKSSPSPTTWDPNSARDSLVRPVKSSISPTAQGPSSPRDAFEHANLPRATGAAGNEPVSNPSGDTRLALENLGAMFPTSSSSRSSDLRERLPPANGPALVDAPIFEMLSSSSAPHSHNSRESTPNPSPGKL